MPQFSESFFLENVHDSDINKSLLSTYSECSSSDLFEELVQVRKMHPRKLIAGHLNINSMCYKFDEIKPLLAEKTVDILFISENKLDPSFRNELFQVEGYRLERRDRNEFGGGVAAFVRTDIPARRRKDLEMQQTESIYYEVNINEIKWAVLCIYRPPSQSNDIFSQELLKCLDKCSTLYDNHILFGDMNYDMLSVNKSKPLIEIMELFDYKKGCTPTLNDVILTNASKKCMKILNFPTGISDCNDFMSTVINTNIVKDEMSKFEYRRFRGFNQEQFLSDLQGIDFSFARDAEGDANAAYELFESQISQVVNKHAPIKQAYQGRKKLPCMNSALKKAIFFKKKFFREYKKVGTINHGKNIECREIWSINSRKNQQIHTFKKDVWVGLNMKIFGKPLSPFVPEKYKQQFKNYPFRPKGSLWDF